MNIQKHSETEILHHFEVVEVPLHEPLSHHQACI